MAAFLNELPKPEKFDTEPISPKAAKNFKHWLKSITSFVDKCEQLTEMQHVEVPNRLQVLFANVSTDIYKYSTVYRGVRDFRSSHGKTNQHIHQVSKGSFCKTSIDDKKATAR